MGGNEEECEFWGRPVCGEWGTLQVIHSPEHHVAEELYRAVRGDEHR